MEIRIIGRGTLAGLIAGIVAFVFAKLFAEPQIDKAIAYESGRDDILATLNAAAGRPVAPDGPEIFSRTIQSTAGLATGIIGFSVAMGALVAVVYLVLHRRFGIRPRTLGLLIAGFGFVGVYLVPFIRYPANPPAIGHEFTIETRGRLYLAMVLASLVFLALATWLGVRLRDRLGVFTASLVAGAAFVVVIVAVMYTFPFLGNLSSNVDATRSFGFARSSTETPQPITDGRGAIVYPGFPADVLWNFRFASLAAQAIVWGLIGIVFSVLVDRFFAPAGESASSPARSTASQT